MRYPVIIVGGGPTGSVCSIHHSLMGMDHLILEASEFPRDKACADILTSKAIRELQALGHGLWGEIQALPSFRPIWGTRVRVEQREFLDIPYQPLSPDTLEPSCIAVKRIELDHLLWEFAKSFLTCTAMEKQRVKSFTRVSNGFSLSTTNNTWTCRNLILANGGGGSLNQNANSPTSYRHTAIGVRMYYENVKLPHQDRCELYLQKKSMPGGFYITPLGDRSFNVNMVIRKDALKRKRINLPDLIQEFKKSDPILKERFDGSRIKTKILGHPLDLGTTNRSRYNNGLFLVGDAGGLIDLISANGIPQAFLSARLASVAISNIQMSEQSEDKVGKWYESELQKQIHADLRIGQRLSPMMSYDWFNSILLDSISKLQDSGQNSLLQDLLYSDDPWVLFKKKVNPLARIQAYNP